MHNDIGIHKNYDVLSYLPCDDNIVHDNYWRSFGFPLYGSSRTLSMILEVLDTPHSRVIFSDHFHPLSYEEGTNLQQHKIDFCHPYLPFPEASYEECFQPSSLI